MEAAVRQPSGAKLLRILANDIHLRHERHHVQHRVARDCGGIRTVPVAGQLGILGLPAAYGLILFSLGSLIGLFAPHYWVILIGRVLQAAGAAVIPAISEIIPVRYFPPESRGRAFGIVMTGLAIGSALGPVVAAFVMSVLNWQWLFCMPLFALLTVPYYFKHLNDKPSCAAGIDWPGGGLFACATALLLAVTNASWMYAGGFLVLFMLFLARIRTAPEPFITPELLRNKPFVSGLAVMFVTTGIGFALVFLSPQLLANVNRLEPGLLGFALVPAAIATALLGRLGGALADRKGHLFLYFLATSQLAVSFMLMSTFAGMSPVLIAVVLIFGNVGQSFLSISLSIAVSRSLPQEQTGVGMGLMAMLSFIASAFASGIYAGIIDRGADAAWNPVNGHPEAAVYSNLYLALAVLHLLLMLGRYAKAARST